MNDLNERVDSNSQCGWDGIQFWMESLEFWTESIALAVSRGDTNCQPLKRQLESYADSVKLAEDMVDFILTDGPFAA